MANFYACMAIQRIVLPATIAACCIFRPVAISFLYLLMYLILPFVPVASAKTINGRTGLYLKILVAISVLTTLCHGIFQIALLSVGFDKIESCGLLEIIFRHIGFISLNELPAIDVAIWLAPEILIFIASIGIYFNLRSLANKTTIPNADQENGSVSPNVLINNEPIYTQEKLKFIQGTAKLLSLTTLLLAAVLRPSITGGLYFLTFLGLMTWWAFYRELERGFAIICRIIMVFLSSHIIAFMIYQTPWPQEYFPANNLLPRLLGFVPLYNSTCNNDGNNNLANVTILTNKTNDIRIITFNSDATPDAILSPVGILLCYYVLALTSSMLLGPKDIKKKSGAFGQLENGTKLTQQVSLKLQKQPTVKISGTREKWRNTTRKVKALFARHLDNGDQNVEPTERTPLMRRSTKRLKNVRNINENEDSIPLDELGRTIPSTDEEIPGIMEQITSLLENITGSIYKNCYIFMNIAMMIWSIMYHSWLTFVLLIWANILWMIPNQRKTMLQSSLFIVIYAELLLLAQYIYGMDLTEEELPSESDIQGINLSQIGLIKYDYMPCGPLIIKTIFTLMFWITLRQATQERKQQRQSSTLADMVAPLQVTVGAATAELAPRQEKKQSSKFITNAVIFLSAICTRFWIWVVVITLFVSGIVGTKMTAFRVFYMCLFLIFLLTFQTSWKVWKKIMYGFWLTVIIYAMIILVLVYTYQFDRFPSYWEKYLNLSQTLQEDVGLKKYKTKDLFLNLALPTIVVIMTVLQLHYFHNKFLSLVEPTTRTGATECPPSTSVARNYENIDEPDNSSERNKKIINSIISRSGLSKREIYQFFAKVKKVIIKSIEIFFIIMDIHLIKLVIFFAFFIGIKQTCVLHISMVFLAVIGGLTRTNIQIVISRIISVLVAIFFLTKMIYQLKYIEHENYDIYCRNDTNITSSTDMNNAEWFGFHKIAKNSNLPDLLKYYIAYIVIVTADTIIRLRQKIKRIRENKSTERPNVIFENITRADAEKNLKSMIKYLFNYGFYKFGLEICLIATVIVIGIRMDIMALFYAIWLCVLFHMKREKLSAFWPVFQWFTALSIVIQYIVVVGAPPGLCLEYPWKEGLLKNLQIWAMLPDHMLFKTAGKIIGDFILLMLLTRQAIVFRVDRLYINSENDYKGGTNKSVLNDIDNLGISPFVNPTPDFTSYVRNWLDVLKRAILLGFFWLALAIVFLTGANRVSLFSIGYLIGSFTFLWQGSDFYLRPIRVILKWWIHLIGYNVFVITSKTILQIPGCLFYQELESNACWSIQLLSIVCVQKETPTNPKICNVNTDQSSVIWDVICFAFLIMQYRIFQSHYFCHIVNDTKAGTILASRGAELIHELRMKQKKQDLEREAEILKKLKMKMDRIKATQKKFSLPVLSEPKTHAEDVLAPLARTHSLSSCAGYHTPIEDEIVGSVLIEMEVSDLPSEITGLGPATSRGGSLLTTQAQSPSSAVMTVSLDGYLEPQRLSFSSPPGSELMANNPNSDESYPVFSPPPSEEIRDGAQNNTLGPPRTVVGGQTPPRDARQHRRQSSLNTVSWPDQYESNINYRNRLLSSNLDPPDETENMPLSPRIRRGHRRQSSMGGSSWLQEDTINQQRRCSDISWVNEDENSARIGRPRPFSWGPIGEISFRQSILSTTSRSPLSHHESIRSGDYYMFDEMDDKLELDLLTQKSDDDEDDANAKYVNKMTLGELLTTKLNESNQQQRTSESDPGRDSSVHQEYQIDPTRSIMSEPISSRRHDVHDDDDMTSYSEKLIEKDAKIRKDDPRPSTSKGSGSQPPDDNNDDDDDDDKNKDITETISEEDEEQKGRLIGLRLIWAFIEGTIISLIIRLNRVSRHYRYVMRVLAREKIELKTSQDFGVGRRTGSSMKWIPHRINSDSTESSTAEISQDKFITAVDDVKLKDTEDKDFTKPGLAAHYAAMQRDATIKPKPEERRTSEVPEIRILAPSLERGLDEVSPSKVVKQKLKDRRFKVDEIEDFSEKEHTPIVELLMAIWFAILSNTDLVCYFMVFLNQINSASILSLPLPFMVFCWGTLTIPRPSKTFWITLIAYTQIIVLIKCVFQFELLWWNQQAIPPNQPLAPIKILGIEKKKQYATYDLILLLILFFHRFMLKSLGLWKSDYKEEVLSEGTYQVHENSNPEKNKNDEVQILNNDELAKDDDNTDKKENIYGTDGQALILSRVSSDVVLCPETDIKLVKIDEVPDTSKTGFSSIIKLSLNKHCSPLRAFFAQLLDRSSRISADVYALMFFCDFINFMVVLFGFTAFGQGGGGVAEYFEENKMPLTFLFMMILQFILIIVDRALYLRKFMLGKIIFQYILTVGIHIWMFFILPAVTERSFNAKSPPVIWYMIKCFYLLFSAYQIRCGYPTRILGNFLTKSFNFVNMLAFKVYYYIPFLFELRTVMDWIWTDTSMTLFDWFKMEDIFTNIYQLKCSRKMESDFPAPRGEKKKMLVKYLMGGGLLFLLITIIWFPMGLFAFGNSVGESNPPFDVTVSLSLGPYESIYKSRAQGNNIQTFSEENWQSLNHPYLRDRTALTFLSNYEASDVSAVDLSVNSLSTWGISPPEKKRLILDLTDNVTLMIRFKYEVSHVSHSKENPGLLTAEASYEFKGNDPQRPTLIKMLNEQSTESIMIPTVLPKFLKVKNSGALKPVLQLIPLEYMYEKVYSNVSLGLFYSQNPSNQSEQIQWWTVREICTGQLYKDLLGTLPYADCEQALVIYTFSDKLFPSNWSFLTAGGILGMYTTFVIFISRIIRGLFSGGSSKIMFEELPYVDRIVQLCLDIYLVRESLEFALEEDLFGKLIFLYRSPETMIKWTRPKEEGDDDNDGNDGKDGNDDTSSVKSSRTLTRRKNI